MLFKEKLKKYREDNNLSQEDLASKLFVSRTLISKWENGVIYPTGANMEKLASIMGVEINDLLSNNEAKALTLNANSKREFNFTQKFLFTVSIILLSVGITLLIIGFIFPQDLTRPLDMVNSVNTITVLCFILKLFGAFVSVTGGIIMMLTFLIKKRLQKNL